MTFYISTFIVSGNRAHTMLEEKQVGGKKRKVMVVPLIQHIFIEYITKIILETWEMQLNKTGKQIYEQFLLLVATTKITGTRSEPVHLGPIYSLIMKLPPTSLFLYYKTKRKQKQNKKTNNNKRKLLLRILSETRIMLLG